MKTHLLLTLVSLSAALSQESSSPPTINVSGSAEIKVAPDEIYLRMGVETRHENLEVAKKQNDERVSRALAFLKASQAKSKDVQTDFINIQPTYDDDISRTKPAVFVIRKSIEVKSGSIESFEAILTGLLTNGVNNVDGIEFRTSQLRKHRDAARAMAVRAAKEKADALAAELGVKRGKVHNINANESGGWGIPYWGGGSGTGLQNVVQNVGGPAIPDEGTLSIGQISVSATVNVSFLIE